jgi:HK97 family phage portal protein
MGFWQRLFGGEAKNSSLELFREIYGGGRESHAGKIVNLETTLEDDAAYACMRVISEGCAQVPWHLYRDQDGSKKIASEHSLDSLISTSPNDYGQTSFEFRETLLLHLLVAGNAYVFVNRVGSERRIRELILIEPRRVTVRQKPDYSLEYTVRADNGESRIFGNDAIWHVRGPSWNAWAGLDSVKMARNAIGLSASLEQGQSEFQKNGARVTGIVSVKDKLDKAQFELLSNWIALHQIGQERSHLPLIIDREGKFQSSAMTGVDQQLIETRRHQVESICRRFRVMPLMVGHPADMAARAATESIFLQHVVHTLMPWYQRIEQSANVNLLSDEERRSGYYTKFNANALMRGAVKDRAEYYSRALGSGGTKGWMTQNDVRALEEMDRSDDPEADKLPQPTNAAKPVAPSADEPKPSEDDED